MNCKCGKPLTKWNGETWKTLVGYGGPPGHVHDDNCNKREYFCDDGHANLVIILPRCPTPGCDWKGRPRCNVCGVDRVESWPDGMTLGVR